jgi:hypothetical protein
MIGETFFKPSTLGVATFLLAVGGGAAALIVWRGGGGVREAVNFYPIIPTAIRCGGRYTYSGSLCIYHIAQRFAVGMMG